MRSTFVLLALAATTVAARSQRRTCSYSCPEHDAFGGPLVTGFAVFGQLQCTYFAGVCTYSASTGAARIPSIGLCHSTAVSSCATSSSTKSSAISSSSSSSVKPSTSASASAIGTSTISTGHISSSSSSYSSASSAPFSTSATYTPTSLAITAPSSIATASVSSPSSSSIKPSTSTSTSASTSTTASTTASTSTSTSTSASTIPTSSTSISFMSSLSSSSASTSSASSTSATYSSTTTSTTVPSSSLTPKIALPAGWSTAYGCAVDTSSRVLGSSEYYQLPNTNTPAACIALCSDRGFSLAGVEYGYECLCASSYVDGPLAPANVSDCNVPCAGDASQTCGGGMRLQIYSNPDALAEAAALPSGWTQTSACSVDTPERVFADTASTTLANNTPAHCIQHCSAMGYAMAGVEDSDECYCGSSYMNDAAPPSVSVDQCSSECKGAPGLTCGGEYAIQLYARK